MERLTKIGKVKAFAAREITKSRMGIGFEKLDRAVFDPEKAYDKVSRIGAKWARIQSGWERTEKERGKYDFAWIDSIVDNLLTRGMQPWMCLCYGNPLYNPGAALSFGSVGFAPVWNDDQKQGWTNYVRAVVKHFKGRVQWYEVWNEPDWCWREKNEEIPKPYEFRAGGTGYGQFVVDTSRAVREADPEAKVIGGCYCGCGGMNWVMDMMQVPGVPEAMDAFSYHAYHRDECAIGKRNEMLRNLVRSFKPDIIFIQGETGTQSSSKGCGALKGMAWTPAKQAKFLSRHLLKDLMEGVMFTSYFSCMDMAEALNGTRGDVSTYKDFGYFGVLGAEFDENGVASGTYTPKPSYYALQNVCSLFREDVECCTLVANTNKTSEDGRIPLRYDCPFDQLKNMVSGGFRKSNGTVAFAYWKPTDILTTTWENDMRLEVTGISGKARLVDVLDGSVYDIPDSMVKDYGNGTRLFLNLPVRDYPLLLTFGDFAEVEPISKVHF